MTPFTRRQATTRQATDYDERKNELHGARGRTHGLEQHLRDHFILGPMNSYQTPKKYLFHNAQNKFKA
ncbi:hypothetical protein TSAR_010129 [Trichomalopsis sarcophagae]|uniref:Uncharacterized protein n=1 Tax=Trichomalopsis sarcophagae TaxID=543379 RepID=A0A232F0F9_9HYME|nr:hypothetical protein TSAR_010129 [Trichomalopsis sarcophagae]